jgi:ABC-2 type transport system ATP-binding protein
VIELERRIIGYPTLLFLNEPTTGFDPSARRDAWDVVWNRASRGTAVILTTHNHGRARGTGSFG